MDLADTVRTVLAQLLDEKLQPLQSDVRTQAQAITRLTEEISSLHELIARGASPFMESSKSFDAAIGRKSLPGGPRASLPTDAPRLRTEEAKSHRKVESAPKTSDAKRKADELAQKREEEKANKERQKEEEKANKEKAKKEAEAKKAEEEAKKKAAKTRPATAAKAEETKKKTVAKKGGAAERKSIEPKQEEPEQIVDTIAADPEEHPSVDPEVLLSLQSAPILPSDSLHSLPSFSADPKFTAIDTELKLLSDTYGEQTLLAVAPFQLSVGARSALSLLNTVEDSQLYLTSLPARDEVFWVFRLFFQLCGEPLSDNKEEAWAVCRTFLVAGKATGLEEKVAETAAGFSFSNENIDQVEALLGDRVDRINPSLYNTFCTLSGLMMFPIKEALAYAGLLPEKVQPWRKYQRLLHKRKKIVQE